MHLGLAQLIETHIKFKVNGRETFAMKMMDTAAWLLVQSLGINLTLVIISTGIYYYLKGMSSFLEHLVVLWSCGEFVFLIRCYYFSQQIAITDSRFHLDCDRANLITAAAFQDINIGNSIRNWFNPVLPGMVTFNQAKSWLGWYLFNKHEDQITEAQNLEMCLKLSECAKQHRIKFTDKEPTHCPIGGPIQSPIRSPMRLTLDAIPFKFKPLLYYSIIKGISLLFSLYLKHLGFKSYYIRENQQSYWIKSPVQPITQSPIAQPPITQSPITKPPIIFVHGIGIGLSTYLRKIQLLAELYQDRNIVLFEIPHVSLVPASKVHTAQESLASFDTIFKSHNLSPGIFLGHSYGTAVVSWVMRLRPNLIKKSILIDPICFKTWDPSLTRNFIYAEIQCFFHRLAQFFFSHDLFVAHSLTRHFNWGDNTILAEEIKCPTRVYLSRNDFIINAPEIKEYLLSFKSKLNLDLKVTIKEDYNHGWYLLDHSHMTRIVHECEDESK